MKKWEIMKAHEEGAEVGLPVDGVIVAVTEPSWNWPEFDYQVMPTEAELWLKKWKGKKVRWSEWGTDEYFIPEVVDGDNAYGNGHEGERGCWNVVDNSGGYWEEYKEPTEEPDAFRVHKIEPNLIAEDTEVKLCKDCEHYSGRSLMHCAIDEAKLTSFIDGSIIDNRCLTARDGGQCGIEGKFWEAKK